MFIPYLGDPSSRVRVFIAELLAFGVRIPKHRNAVTDWMPADDRLKTPSKSKRGWENTALVDAKSPGRQGGWVIRHLTAMLLSRESRVSFPLLSI